MPLQPEYLLCRTEEEFVFRNFEGQIIRCRNPRVLDDAQIAAAVPDPAVCNVLTFPQREIVQ